MLFVILFFLVATPLIYISGKSGEDYFHSHTKAICDGNNFCEDYEIQCNGKKVLSINPTGFAVQFSEDWKDLRDEEIKKKLCE